ncbi:hypothetical protein HOLleu_34415 [Holothuria leucospilota]|uniref:Ig-like domain-containing protein n=1 Tax=Holothuria leucospilota TaxID=206669 RepID=A0A9Q0YL66_HOLLE|nr:hypothetical protein HOLleu_34415 [Holothuria leucospilota]
MKVPKKSILKLAIIFVVVVTFTSASQGCGDHNFVGTIHTANILGFPVELPCNVTSYEVVSWALIEEKTQNYIALGTNVFQKLQQHYSLNLSTITRKDNIISESLVYNLIVNEASEDLEGSYVCNEDGCNKSKVILSVQAVKPFQREPRMLR